MRPSVHDVAAALASWAEHKPDSIRKRIDGPQADWTALVKKWREKFLSKAFDDKSAEVVRSLSPEPNDHPTVQRQLKFALSIRDKLAELKNRLFQLAQSEAGDETPSSAAQSASPSASPAPSPRPLASPARLPTPLPFPAPSPSLSPTPTLPPSPSPTSPYAPLVAEIHDDLPDGPAVRFLVVLFTLRLTVLGSAFSGFDKSSGEQFLCVHARQHAQCPLWNHWRCSDRLRGLPQVGGGINHVSTTLCSSFSPSLPGATVVLSQLPCYACAKRLAIMNVAKVCVVARTYDGQVRVSCEPHDETISRDPSLDEETRRCSRKSHEGPVSPPTCCAKDQEQSVDQGSTPTVRRFFSDERIRLLRELFASSSTIITFHEIRSPLVDTLLKQLMAHLSEIQKRQSAGLRDASDFWCFGCALLMATLGEFYGKSGHSYVGCSAFQVSQASDLAVSATQLEARSSFSTLRCVAMGCNGYWPGHSEVDMRMERIRSLHAEENLLRLATSPLAGATVFLTFQPCDSCARLLKDAGVAAVSSIYRSDHYVYSARLFPPVKSAQDWLFAYGKLTQLTDEVEKSQLGFDRQGRIPGMDS